MYIIQVRHLPSDVVTIIETAETVKIAQWHAAQLRKGIRNSEGFAALRNYAVQIDSAR